MSAVKKVGDEIVTPMPECCTKCRTHFSFGMPVYAPLVNRNGFMCCVQCGVSYGPSPEWARPKPTKSFNECSHENASLKCNDCGIDFRHGKFSRPALANLTQLIDAFGNAAREYAHHKGAYETDQFRRTRYALIKAVLGVTS